ncbi:hypothetical protein MPH_04254 [Macrophomina phaseolina MS6]|uniref:Uncharacterized protein n=1 Tax=Macrophomina phaseolina (strain MS6) TaxID=1126212 RepID=K2S0G2_MACPH|nr:hypothetical protein MPH_04254 [Macrophomina phaseolina MS6]
MKYAIQGERGRRRADNCEIPRRQRAGKPPATCRTPSPRARRTSTCRACNTAGDQRRNESAWQADFTEGLYIDHHLCKSPGKASVGQLKRLGTRLFYLIGCPISKRGLSYVLYRSSIGCHLILTAFEQNLALSYCKFVGVSMTL